MNLPNKLTICRIVMAVLIVVVLLFPFRTLGISTLVLLNDTIVVDVKYLVAGVLFVIGSLTDFIDGRIARKYNMVTELGKVLDAIADKLLVNPVLIILSAQGVVHPLITVIVISRDTIVNTIKMIVGNKKGAVAAIKSGKIKTTFMMIGIALTLFNNLPFELWNLNVSSLILIIATVLSVYSGIEYYQISKDVLFEKN